MLKAGAIPHQRAERDPEVMLGGWSTEVESAAAFDAVVPTDLFNVHREVRGTLIAPRPEQVERSMRIDRVLIPTDHLLSLGWKYGIIGCELKRSAAQVGPAIAQAMDYSRTVWTLEPSKFQVWLGYIFIWPMPKFHGAMASICTQHRIGSAVASAEYDWFQLKSGEVSVLKVEHGKVKLGQVLTGSRAGSR